MHMMKHRESGLVVPLQSSVAGRFRVEVYRSDGRKRSDTGWFDNNITDSGLDYLGDPSKSYLAACQVGSGTTAPSDTDTDLQSFVAGTDILEENTTTAEGSAPYFGAITRRYRFGQGDAAGNLSEVGVGPTKTNAEALFSRALIVDGSGSPTTVTVLSDEFLDVSYQLQHIVPTGDVIDTVVDSGPAGVSHNIIARASLATNSFWAPEGQGFAWDDGFGATNTQSRVYDGDIQTITGSPLGTSSAKLNPINDAYTAGSHKRTATYSLGLDDGNFGTGIKSLGAVTENGGGIWQISFDPVINKDNSKILSLGVELNWSRGTPI